MSDNLLTIHVKNLTQQHQLVGVSKPKYPLFSILRYEDFPKIENQQRLKYISDFYQVVLKKDCPCKAQYGQTQYDFDEGVMSFYAPRQVNIIEPGYWQPESGYLLQIHPEFLRGSSLMQKIKTYGFFEYAANEALILSEEEQQSIENAFHQIEREYLLPMDRYSQDVVLSNIDLLLTYCNRYYNRQFITRKPQSSPLLDKVERLLDAYFANGTANNGLPTAQYLASELALSSKYLSDALKQLTGQTTQQLIHEKLIERAKDMLTTTDLSIGEIAYQLGFEYPQSFNKLFKNKTQQSPLTYRVSFN